MLLFEIISYLCNNFAISFSGCNVSQIKLFTLITLANNYCILELRELSEVADKI